MVVDIDVGGVFCVKTIESINERRIEDSSRMGIVKIMIFMNEKENKEFSSRRRSEWVELRFLQAGGRAGGRASGRSGGQLLKVCRQPSESDGRYNLRHPTRIVLTLIEAEQRH